VNVDGYPSFSETVRVSGLAKSLGRFNAANLRLGDPFCVPLYTRNVTVT
jgi:hypothetical protein